MSYDLAEEGMDTGRMKERNNARQQVIKQKCHGKLLRCIESKQCFDEEVFTMKGKECFESGEMNCRISKYDSQ